MGITLRVLEGGGVVWGFLKGSDPPPVNSQALGGGAHELE